MFYIDFISGNNKLTIPINTYLNDKKDLNLNFSTYPNLHKIVSVVLLNYTRNQTYKIIFRNDEKIMAEREYDIFIKNPVLFFFTGRLSSNINIELQIQKLLSDIPHYKIIVENHEICKVYDGDTLIEDLEYFINNIYQKCSNRLYRKFATYTELVIFKCDVEY